MPYQVLRFVLVGRRRGLYDLQERYSKFVHEISPATFDLVIPTSSAQDRPPSAGALKPDKRVCNVNKDLNRERDRKEKREVRKIEEELC